MATRASDAGIGNRGEVADMAGARRLGMTPPGCHPTYTMYDFVQVPCRYVCPGPKENRQRPPVCGTIKKGESAAPERGACPGRAAAE